jgi:hypothetical protein
MHVPIASRSVDLLLKSNLIGESTMNTSKLDKSEWRAFFDGLAAVLGPKQAEIETVGLALGEQVEAEWLPLRSLSHDPKNDVVDVALEGLDHRIWKPREIYVGDEIEGLLSFAIVDSEGNEHILKFRDPLMLPAPHA